MGGERRSRAAANLCSEHRVVGGHLSETLTKRREWPPTRREQEGAVPYVLLRRQETSWLGFFFSFFCLLLNVVGTRHDE